MKTYMHSTHMLNDIELMSDRPERPPTLRVVSVTDYVVMYTIPFEYGSKSKLTNLENVPLDG